ncbi:hypothetical protein RSSM_01317 [Rhodopirellula sallentina SM41]|uniref:Uncharacterized protein n=1 Tax=Rhodopirellula sallentina SM41 TaxID=1263870 RepID=M5UHD5_9BACT|nr:hypothetical protein RSSM_01317 [Rhodopirellula sallentina SM41]
MFDTRWRVEENYRADFTTNSQSFLTCFAATDHACFAFIANSA